MLFGIHMLPTEYGIDVRTLARAVEAHGFESLFLAEHTHMPLAGTGELAREFKHSLDPFVALGAVAAVTKQLRIGTAVCLVAQRDPIMLAKEVATLDVLSGGRFLFGVGAGWHAGEMANHGTPPELRWKIMRERILAIKRIWTEETPSFQGAHVSFDPIWQWPKPVQKPHPPILVGGNGALVLQRVVEYGDEWFPLASQPDYNKSQRPEDDLELRIAELRRRAAEASRPAIPVSIFGAPEDQAALERYAQLDIKRCVFSLAPDAAEDVLPRIERLAELIRRTFEP